MSVSATPARKGPKKTSTTSGRRPIQRKAVPAIAPTSVLVGAVLLAVSPLAVVPWGLETLPLSKAFVAGIGVILILLGSRQMVVPRAVSIALMACVGALIIATLSSTDIAASIFGRYPRYEGLWVVMIYMAAIAAGARLRHWPNAIRTFGITLSIASTLVFIVALGEMLASDADQRIDSLLGNASELGLWSAVVLFLLASGALERQPLALLGVATAFGSILLSASRGALLAVLVGAIVLVAFRARSRSGRVILGALLAGAVVVMLLPFTRDRILGTDAIASRTAAGRWDIWGSAGALIRDNLLFGVGPSGFVDGAPRYYTDGFATGAGERFTLDSPHNLILQILVVGGVVLLVAVAALVVVWIKSAIVPIRQHPQLMGSVIAAIAAGVVGLQTHITTPGTVPLLAALAGFVVATKPRAAEAGSGQDARGQLLRFAPVAAVGIAIVALGLALIAEMFAASATRALEAGDAQAAQSGWATTQALRPWDSDVLLRQARTYNWAVSSGLVEATACLEPSADAIAARPRSQEATVDRAKCLAYNGDLSGAQEVLEVGLTSNPKSQELQTLLRRAIKMQAGA
jgi:O-antigen ligase